MTASHSRRSLRSKLLVRVPAQKHVCWFQRTSGIAQYHHCIEAMISIANSMEGALDEISRLGLALSCDAWQLHTRGGPRGIPSRPRIYLQVFL